MGEWSQLYYYLLSALLLLLVLLLTSAALIVNIYKYHYYDHLQGGHDFVMVSFICL